MRILVACEFSGTVRDAFAALGHDAWSCDLLPTETPGQHIEGDIAEALSQPWDLVIAHPPCTYLTVSGNKWMAPAYSDRFPNRREQREAAIRFFLQFVRCAPRVAIENPIGIMSSLYQPPTQVIQPWMFGHPESKATCLWLYGLPALIPTNSVALPADKKLAQRLHWLPPSPDRWKERSRTYPGIAAAMADQWGGPFRLRG